MNIKRIAALALSCALLCAALPLPSAEAAETPATIFTDIPNADMAEAAETLRLLGIVSGTGGTAFQPDRALTRAEFSKMAVELMGNGDLVAAQMNRTIFKDVPGSHWARGYIAVATQSSTSGTGESAVTTPGIIRGDAYGNFNPDRTITAAEALTILVRILGYGDGDVGMVWPNGYLSKADELGLTEGVVLSPDAPLTRGQAALLMENLLFTNDKSGKRYLESLGCSITEETIIFSVDTAAPDGSSGVKAAQDKVYKTEHAPFSDDLVGRRAKLVLDEDEKVVAIQPSETGTQKVVTVLSLNFDSIKTSGDASVEIEEPKTTTVYQNGKEITYESLYLSGLTAGTQAVLQYSAAGELEYIFLRDAVKTDSATTVVKNKPSYSGEAAYPVYKNGVLSSVMDIRQYDVTTFDSANNVMYVSDLRVTGVYENVYPNRETPSTITVMGHEFSVLPSAAADLRSFQVGASITLLLSYNGQVAGAVSPSVVKSTTIGTVKSIDQNGAAVVTAINLTDTSGKPIEFSGQTSFGNRADSMIGQLVTVSSSTKGRLSLVKLSGKGAKAPLDMSTLSMGDIVLADNVKLYEQTYHGPIEEIELDDITCNIVPVEKMSYVRTNYAGKADIIIFNDVTGDQYEYGFLKYFAGISVPNYDDNGNIESYDKGPASISIVNALNPKGSTQLYYDTSNTFSDGAAYGIAEGPTKSNGDHTLGGYVKLQSMTVLSSAFDTDAMVVNTPSMVIPIADNVQCYNESTGGWFPVGEDATEESYLSALNLARAFSEKVTIYYDKSPDEGGKVRLVVAG